jgi:hypothetical protein
VPGTEMSLKPSSGTRRCPQSLYGTVKPRFGLCGRGELNARGMTQAVDMLEVVAPLCYALKGDFCCPRTLASPASGRFVERAVAEMDTPKMPCKPGAVCIACEADETAGRPQHKGVPRTPRPVHTM